MSKEIKKTLGFVVAALVIGITGLGLQARRSTTRTEISKEVGKVLFDKLTDSASLDQVASLEVVEVNEGLADMRTFKIAKQRGGDTWVIPSESEYPADAADQVRDAATMFVNLEIVDVASEISDDHDDLGVLEPNEENVGKDGVGKLIILQDRKNEDLARLIIGKEVKEPANHRFVRRPGQDVVFVAKVDDSKLSTRFADWIKKDLLDVNAFDIEDVELKDYSVVDVQDGQFIRKILSPRMEASLNYDNGSSKWELKELLTYNDENEKTPSPLGPDEELDSQKLNDLKYAVDDLEIVAVYPKPEGLGADLRAGADFADDRENQASLAERGFFPQKLADGGYDLKAANGEAHVTTKDGIQYILRFGEINVGDGVEEGKVNRYLFVSARVDESKFPLPVKETLPGSAGPKLEPALPPTSPPDPDKDKAPDDAKKDDAKKDDAKKDDAKQDDAKQDDAKQDDAKQDDAKKDDAKKDDAKQDDAKKDDAKKDDAKKDDAKQDDAKQDDAKKDSGEDDAKQDAGEVDAKDGGCDFGAEDDGDPQDPPAAAKDDAKKDDAKKDDAKKDDAKKDDAKKDDAKTDDAKTDDAKTDDAKTDDPAQDPVDPSEFRKLQEEGLPDRMDDTVREAEIKRIEKEFQRKVDERDENLKKAAARVAELNARFAGWYYVVSEDTYKKIHLGRADIVKKKAPEAPEGAGDSAVPGPSFPNGFGNP